MSRNTKTILVVLILLAAGTILVLGSITLANLFLTPDWTPRGPHRQGFRPNLTNFRSNGERIYFDGTSETGPAITARLAGMHRMPASQMSCAVCHGEDARGGTVRMMMSTVEAPAIRWEHLTEEQRDDEHGKEHPVYTVDTFKQAVTEGLDPSGEELHWMMPRWDMTEAQLDDLVAYLQSLD
jgi:mono/diheme cytochrome c family protein